MEFVKATDALHTKATLMFLTGVAFSIGEGAKLI